MAVENQCSHRARFRERKAAGLVQENPKSGAGLIPPPVPRPVVPGEAPTLRQQMQAQQAQQAAGAVPITGNATGDPQKATSHVPPEPKTVQPDAVVPPAPPTPPQEPLGGPDPLSQNQPFGGGSSDDDDPLG